MPKRRGDVYDVALPSGESKTWQEGASLELAHLKFEELRALVDGGGQPRFSGTLSGIDTQYDRPQSGYRHAVLRRGGEGFYIVDVEWTSFGEPDEKGRSRRGYREESLGPFATFEEGFGAAYVEQRIPDEHRVVRIEMEYADGRIMRAVGEDAHVISDSWSAQAFLAWNHGERYAGPFLKEVPRCTESGESPVDRHGGITPEEELIPVKSVVPEGPPPAVGRPSMLDEILGEVIPEDLEEGDGWAEVDRNLDNGRVGWWYVEDYRHGTLVRRCSGGREGVARAVAAGKLDDHSFVYHARFIAVEEDLDTF